MYGVVPFSVTQSVPSGCSRDAVGVPGNRNRLDDRSRRRKRDHFLGRVLSHPQVAVDSGGRRQRLRRRRCRRILDDPGPRQQPPRLQADDLQVYRGTPRPLGTRSAPPNEEGLPSHLDTSILEDRTQVQRSFVRPIAGLLQSAQICVPATTHSQPRDAHEPQHGEDQARWLGYGLQGDDPVVAVRRAIIGHEGDVKAERVQRVDSDRRRKKLGCRIHIARRVEDG